MSDSKKQKADLINVLDELDNKGVPQLKVKKAAVYSILPGLEPEVSQPEVPSESEIPKPETHSSSVVSVPSFLKTPETAAPNKSPLIKRPPKTHTAEVEGTPGLSPPGITAPAAHSNASAAPLVMETSNIQEIPGMALPMTKALSQGTLISPIATQDETPTGDIFKDLSAFIKQLGRAYEFRYSLWESTINTILVILRKMQQNMAQNTEKMLTIIEELHNKIKKGLNLYTIKRDAVERFSEIDYKMVLKTFKKTLELLNFQVREFRLMQNVDELYAIYLN